ncbi:hypothetical protein V8C37DRAFT_372098 [Trichoderma ceciliae]
MDYILPKPDYLIDVEWEWPWNNVGLDPEDLFTTLHARFNTRVLPIQDPESFHRDVRECASFTSDEDEFYSKLEERKAQRIAELVKAWGDIRSIVGTCPQVLTCPKCYDKKKELDGGWPTDTLNDPMVMRWGAFCKLSRTASFDSLITFFDGFSRDERKRRYERSQELEAWDRELKGMLISTSATTEVAPSGSTSLSSLEPVNDKPSVTIAVHDELRAQKSSHGSSTSETLATSGTHNNNPQPTSSPNQDGPQAADQATLVSKVKNSPSNKRKRKSGEDDTRDAHPTRWKKQRVMSDGGENNTENFASGEPEPDIAEAVSMATPKRPEKRKMADDDLQTDSVESRTKRARTDDGPSNLTRCSRSLSPLPSLAPCKSDAGPSEIPNTTGTEDPASRKPKRRPRVSRRRVGKRDGTPSREDHSTPQKQPRKKRDSQSRSQKRKSLPPPVESLLHSKRSSRRNPGHELWYLGDDAVACSVANTR